VASPSKVPPAKATKRVAHVSRRLCTNLGTYLFDVGWKLIIPCIMLVLMFAAALLGQGYEELCCKTLMKMMMAIVS